MSSLYARGLVRGKVYAAELGRTPVVIFMDDCHGVMPVEELLSVVGFPARQGLLPAIEKPNRPHGPT